MKKLVTGLWLILITMVSSGQTRHPYYGGGHHTSGHGGTYAGSSASSHRGGHYVNYRSMNTYGRHKRKGSM